MLNKDFINEVEDYYGGEKVYSLELHQLVEQGNIKTVKRLIKKAEFEEDYEEDLVLEFIEDLEAEADTIRAIVEDYEEKLKKQKSNA